MLQNFHKVISTTAFIFNITINKKSLIIMFLIKQMKEIPNEKIWWDRRVEPKTKYEIIYCKSCYRILTM